MVDKGQENTQRQSIVERRQVLGETVRELLALDDEQGLRLILNNQHQADLADLVVQLSAEDRQRVFAFLAAELAADVLAELDTATMLDVAEDFGEENLSGLVGEMEPDDPAVASGPLITTLNDVFALPIYFAVARLLLHLWG